MIPRYALGILCPSPPNAPQTIACRTRHLRKAYELPLSVGFSLQKSLYWRHCLEMITYNEETPLGCFPSDIYTLWSQGHLLLMLDIRDSPICSGRWSCIEQRKHVVHCVWIEVCDDHDNSLPHTHWSTFFPIAINFFFPIAITPLLRLAYRPQTASSTCSATQRSLKTPTGGTL